jgi:hypothetical protein
MMGALLSYVPFRDPLWGGWNYWYLFLLPLALMIALVYKAIRLDDLNRLAPQTLRAFGKLVGVFAGVALLLWIVVLLLER